MKSCWWHYLWLAVLWSVCLGSERESDGAYSPDEKRHSVHRHQHSDNKDAATEAHHQAIIGDEKEHEQFHKQSPQESQSQLLKMAIQNDLNQDLQISLDELQKWIFQSFSDLNQEDALSRFAEADKDLDGFVTWAEHLKETWGMADEENDLHGDDYKDEVAIIKEEEVLFYAADRDKDGKLTQEEYIIFERPEQFDFMQPLVIQRSKEGRDKNGDGFIDFHEYIVDILPNYKGVLAGEEKETFLAEKERFEQYLDLDRDGKLDDKEIFRWLVPDDNATAAAEAEHIMEQADVNKDGHLTFDEIEKKYDVFVGSEITDYGNALKADDVIVEDEEDTNRDEL